jgi:hypothetical protein
MDAEPGSTEQVVHFAVKVTAPADPVSPSTDAAIEQSEFPVRAGATSQNALERAHCIFRS